ncbi:nickel transport system ATP-binding protein [Paenibacillus endophyticus]|uniref:Nickel transport system ATP-binding protein n=2 Tax=Paenibacillus endophyticus TaxID=1294268 RepID=A0A7W5CCV3_9BACL|nr:nickel transport system ATP-binding protein [Paenibacillus endophyticus]
MNGMHVLEVEHLNIWEERSGRVLVHDSSFRLAQGECLAIVGESGSGKSLTCKSLMRLNRTGVRQSGFVALNGEDLSKLSDKEMRKFRGRRFCMIMQNGMSAFDPSRPIGAHLLETLGVHFNWSRAEMETRLTATMSSVGLKEPAVVMRSYPHELSGGMLQRVMISLAIVLEPDVIIADEPTTALDAVTAYEVVEQFMRLRERLGSAMIFVSHDLGAVRRIADNVLVMKDGGVVEHGTTKNIFAGASHPYTRYLVSSKQAMSRHFEQLMGDADVAKG